MEKNMEVLRSTGIRVTHQRLEVYKLLLNKDKHLTAEEIYSGIQEKTPAISLATVYSILYLFKGKDLVEEIRINFDKSNFGIKRAPHHHFLCRDCGEILDINMTPCGGLEKKEFEGNLVEEAQGYFYGVCKLCLKSNGSKKG